MDDITYTLTCEKCQHTFDSREAFPNPLLCPECKRMEADEIEKLVQLLEPWHYETLSVGDIKNIARTILEAGYLPVEPAQLEVLEVQDVRETLKNCPKIKTVNDLNKMFQSVSQATIAHNQIKGQLYRRVE